MEAMIIKNDDGTITVQNLEQSRVAELRREGASEIIRVGPPEKTKKKENITNPKYSQAQRR